MKFKTLSGRRYKIDNKRFALLLTILILGITLVSGFTAIVVSAQTPAISDSNIIVRSVNLDTYSTEVMAMPQEEVIIQEIYNEEDLWWLSHVIFSENGNQSYEVLLMTGNVILNRVEDERFPDSIKEVVTQKYNKKYQFDVVSNGTINLEPSEEAINAAKAILDGERVLPETVLYFMADYVMDTEVGSKWWTGVETYSHIEDVVFGIQTN